MKQPTIILLAMLFSTWSLGQVEETAPQTKTTVFSIFDTKIEKTDHGDGRKTWEFSPKKRTYEESQKEEKNNKHSGDLSFDIGINTWVPSGEAPKVRPWGSWNPAINLRHTYQPNKNFGLSTLLGVSWYNFKFEDRNLQALRTSQGITFEEFDGQGIKSKITASYLNLAIVPSIASNNGKFRFGAGPYAGYRLGGRGKFVYNDDNGNRNKVFERANMFANNFRYGGRLEIGVGEIDLFVNYDLNNYFQKDKDPKVNALSFGLIL
ncbi:hypothetical protein [Cecembia calidifontis]|jgi:hypothetical protein|uniref:Outer membrane protein with beta-barrel domain n=1 Tax=Cecembia calidifontis TaxID=1187080 RepID=A0A4Q7PB28_9BACT|nr:hypothetical protein [Cecembia calidifontis]RZS96760.1 hypothetical protein BC751_2346 [Cecembia calidifontis]